MTVTEISLCPEDAAWELLTAMHGPGAEDDHRAFCHRIGLEETLVPLHVAMAAIVRGQHMAGHAQRIRECLPRPLADALDLAALEGLAAGLFMEQMATVRASGAPPDRFMLALLRWTRTEALHRALAATEVPGVPAREADLLLYCASRCAEFALADLQAARSPES